MKLIGNKKIFILFVLIAYIFIPMADSMACDDCTGIAPFQGGLGISYKDIPQGNMSSSINIDDAKDKSSSEKEGKIFCPICFNAVEGDFHNHKALFSAVPFANQTIFVVFLEPIFSINKPPQN
jgi:hypothetical protein